MRKETFSKSFHHNATYDQAMKAGFDSEDARVIANACRYIDENSKTSATSFQSVTSALFGRKSGQRIHFNTSKIGTDSRLTFATTKINEAMLQFRQHQQVLQAIRQLTEKFQIIENNKRFLEQQQDQAERDLKYYESAYCPSSFRAVKRSHNNESRTRVAQYQNYSLQQEDIIQAFKEFEGKPEQLYKLSLQSLGAGLHGIQDSYAHTKDVTKKVGGLRYHPWNNKVDNPAYEPARATNAKKATLQYLNAFREEVGLPLQRDLFAGNSYSFSRGVRG